MIFSADLQPVHPVSYLWAIPALPALAAVVLALAGRALQRRFGRAAVSGVALVALGGVAGVLVAAGLGVLARLPADGRLLVDAGWPLVDVGPVTVSATLVLDPLRALFAFAVVLAGARTAALGLARVAEGALVRAAGAVAACVSAATLVILADDAVFSVVAWEALAWVAFVLAPRDADGQPDADAGGRVAEAFAVNRVGQAAWLGALALVFWGLAGGPSRVTADVRGVPGGGMELRTLGDRPLAASVRELPVGPTVALRDVERTLSLRDTSERRPFEEAFLARRAGPLPLALVVCLGFLFGAASLGAATLLAWARAPGASAGPLPPLGSFVTRAVAAACLSLVARFAFLLALSPAAAVAAAVLAVVAVGAGVAYAVRRRAVLAPLIRRLFRDLGVLPASDFARAAAWLDRRLLAPAGGVLALAALVLVAALLVRR